MESTNTFHTELKTAKEMVYDLCNFEFKNLLVNAESIEYGACTFEFESKKILHRVPKITPTKNGQFVTLWKRNKNGKTEPFDLNDDIDFIIITARSGRNLGQFLFPKSALADNQIMSQNGNSGKRGFRVYPPWDKPESKQAEKTQNWQLNYFLTIKSDGSTNLEVLKRLLHFNP